MNVLDYPYFFSCVNQRLLTTGSNAIHPALPVCVERVITCWFDQVLCMGVDVVRRLDRRVFLVLCSVRVCSLPMYSLVTVTVDVSSHSWKQLGQLLHASTHWLCTQPTRTHNQQSENNPKQTHMFIQIWQSRPRPLMQCYFQFRATQSTIVPADSNVPHACPIVCISFRCMCDACLKQAILVAHKAQLPHGIHGTSNCLIFMHKHVPHFHAGVNTTCSMCLDKPLPLPLPLTYKPIPLLKVCVAAEWDKPSKEGLKGVKRAMPH